MSACRGRAERDDAVGEHGADCAACHHLAAVRALFWISSALIVWTQALYAPALALLRRLKGSPPVAPTGEFDAVRHAGRRRLQRGGGDRGQGRATRCALDWPRERLEVIVAVDGAGDATARPRPRGRAPTWCSSCPRGGKIRAQDAAVRAARGEVIAFGDANALWAPDALRELMQAVRRPAGRLRLRPGRRSPTRPAPTRKACTGATRCSCARRSRRWRRSPAATARSTPCAARPTSRSTRSWATTSRSRSGWSRTAGARSTSRAARATEKMVPSIEGEWARKRRMMSHGWPIVVKGGLADPRGYSPLYALMIVSHRLLRYGTPFLHVLTALATLALLRRGRVYRPPRPRRPRWSPPRSPARARSPRSSPATTSSPPPRSPPASTTGCATARPPGWDAPEGTR